MDVLFSKWAQLNPKPELFLPTVDFAIEQAKQLDIDEEEYPEKLGSHVYKVVEKLKKPTPK